MLKHVFHAHTPWGLPGGWLNRHESPAAGALRELKEETGLTAVLDTILFIESQGHPAHLGITYRGRTQSGPLTLSSEILEAGWFLPDDLPGPLQPLVEHAIATAVARTAVPPSQPVKTGDTTNFAHQPAARFDKSGIERSSTESTIRSTKEML